MALLNLLLTTCLTLIVASTIAAEHNIQNDTESFVLESFNETLQDEIIVPKNYNLDFSHDLRLNPPRTLIRIITVRIKFEILKPISYIGLHTNGQKILKDSVLLEVSEETGNRSISFKPEKYYKRRDIIILKFPMLLYNTPYYINIKYENMLKEFEIENHKIDKIDKIEKNCLYRILDNSNGFGTISLNSAYSSNEPEIIISFHSFPEIQLFIPTVTMNFMKGKHVVAFYLSTIPIYEVIILMTKNFEKSHYEDINFWHIPNIQNKIKHALIVSHKVWWQMRYYTSNLPKDKKSFTNPALNIVAPNVEYPTVSGEGIIVYRQKDITFNEIKKYFAQKAAVEMTVSYEISRQIFSYIVHPSTWVTKCLQESLAVYLHYSIFDQIESYKEEIPEDLLGSYLYVVQILQQSLYNDAAFRLKNISHGINSADEFEKSFISRMYYNKGSALMYMLESVVSKTVMRRVISEYLKQHLFQRSDFNNFWDIASKKDQHNRLRANSLADDSSRTNVTMNYSRIPFKKMMRSWLSQSHYPEINVQATYLYKKENIEISLYQDIFQDKNCANASCSCEDCFWPIFMPISVYQWNEPYNIYTTHKTWKFTGDLVAHDLIILGEFDLMVLNLGQAGFYRINYDDKTWTRIILFLNHQDYTKIHVLNRAQFIDDMYHFVINGKHNWLTFLELANYLKRETSYIAWYPMINIMTYMTHFFHHPASQFIKPRLAEIFGSLLENIGYIENKDDDDMTKSLRILGSWWACKLGHRVCQETAKKTLTKFLKNSDKNLILPWWERWIFCAGIMKGDNEVFYAILLEYCNHYDEQLFKFLSCSKSTTSVIDFFNLFKKVENCKLVHNYATNIEFPQLKYYHLSPFIKRHSSNYIAAKAIISNIENFIPGTLKNTRFWADIILNIYSKAELRIVHATILLYVNENLVIKSAVDDLVNRQLQRIDTLLSTHYYI